MIIGQIDPLTSLLLTSFKMKVAVIVTVFLHMKSFMRLDFATNIQDRIETVTLPSIMKM